MRGAAGDSSCSRKYAAATSCARSSASRSAALSRRLRLFELGDRHAEALRELPHRSGEADLFLQLHELEDVAASPAAETVKEPAIAMDREATATSHRETDRVLCSWCRPSSARRSRNDGHDVSGVADFVDERLWKAQSTESFSSHDRRAVAALFAWRRRSALATSGWSLRYAARPFGVGPCHGRGRCGLLMSVTSVSSRNFETDRSPDRPCSRSR